MKDNFSKDADLYARYRPGYPPELISFILEAVEDRRLAWDCATGNGQSAGLLAPYFEQVYATDISQRQLDEAIQARNIIYSVQPAEKTSFADNSFDLITVSQALHWFRFEDFYTELRRVAQPGAVFAAWTYSLLSISPEIDALIRAHHFTTLAYYWDAERKYVDERYETIPFPFEPLPVKPFFVRYTWTLGELEGYLNTWSALRKFRDVHSINPVDELMLRIREQWSSPTMHVLFPLHLKLGKIVK